MADVGSGLDSLAIEQDPSIAQLQAQQASAQAALQVNLPATNFVASIDGLIGLLNFISGSNISVTNDGVSNITISVIGLATAATAKSNIAAAPPTPGNDESEGYAVFSLWLDTSVPNFYLCASNATAAAVWVLIG